MGIKIFILFLFGLILFYLSLDVNIKAKRNIKTIKPNIEFKKSVMYDINDNKIDKVIQSRVAKSYKDFDELYDVIIVFKDKNSFNTIGARYILKKYNVYKMYDDVYLNRFDGFMLSSNFLEFNDKNKILKNDTEFVINYKNSITYGDNLFLDMVKEEFIANNIDTVIK